MLNHTRWPSSTATIVAAALSLTAAASLAQGTDAPTFNVPATNPPAVVRQRVVSSDIEVAFNRPSMKGRTIFGTLVPYGRVWRTGSDNATKLTLSTPVTIQGKRIEAGSYELFSIPGEREWTVIIHRNQSQWGSYQYNSTNDVARVTVMPVRLNQPVESFSIGFSDVRLSSATMNIEWEHVRVPIQIAVDVRETVVPRLEEALGAEGRRPYFLAAMFYFEHELDINRAAELMAKAIEGAPQHIGMLHRQALILEKKGDVAGAIAAAEKSLAGAQTSSPELKDEYTRLNAPVLARLRARQ